jgi:hypothetical protein
MYTELFNPIYGTVDGLPVIVLGAVSTNGAGESATRWVIADDDGRIRIVEIADVVVDVRFSDGRWVDTSPGSMADD